MTNLRSVLYNVALSYGADGPCWCTDSRSRDIEESRNTWQTYTHGNACLAARAALDTKPDEPECCEMWMVRGPTEEYGMVYLPSYGGTKQQVEEKVMSGARREGFKGTLKERLEMLEWEIVRGTFHVNRSGES